MRKLIAEAYPGHSVTTVALVRLNYLIKSQQIDATSPNVVSLFINISIWTGVEVNMSVICGQYTISTFLNISLVYYPLLCGGEKKKIELANMSGFWSLLACLPSLGPVTTFVSDKLRQLPARKSTRKHNVGSLAKASRKVDAPIVLRLSKIESWDDGPRSTLDSSFVTDMETKVLPTEMNATKNWISKVETVESV